MDQTQKHSGALPPRPADEQDATDDKRSASDVVPRARDLPNSSVSSQLKRSNSLARLRAAALDLETELSYKETNEQELERQVAVGEREAQSLRGRIQALEAELAGAKAATRLSVERARLAHEALQDEQDAFLALLLDDHEMELKQLKVDRDEALAKAALAEHKQLRGHDAAELERRLSWLRGECDEAHRAAEESHREADDARAERDRARTQFDAAVDEAERLRSLLGANMLKQRPTQTEIALNLPSTGTTPNTDGSTPAVRQDHQPTAQLHFTAARMNAERVTATAIPAAMFHPRDKLSSSAPSSAPAAAPSSAQAEEASRRQGVRTAPAVPQPEGSALRAGLSDDGAFELDTIPPPALARDLFASAQEPGAQPNPSDALDMTRDLDWGKPSLREDLPAVPQRNIARPSGPADQPPVVLKKPVLARSPGGYSMPDDASGTIEVLTPLTPIKR